jgi:hypothetical protein
MNLNTKFFVATEYIYGRKSSHEFNKEISTTEEYKQRYSFLRIACIIPSFFRDFTTELELEWRSREPEADLKTTDRFRVGW